MEWLNWGSIIWATVVFPGAVFHYMVDSKSSTEHFITELREGRLKKNEIKQLARMHATVLGDETALHLMRSGQISDGFARNLMLGINPISEMLRMHPVLVPASGLLFTGAAFGLVKRYGWSNAWGYILLPSLLQLYVWDRRNGRVVGDMRYSKTFRAMKLDKMYGDNK